MHMKEKKEKLPPVEGENLRFHLKQSEKKFLPRQQEFVDDLSEFLGLPQDYIVPRLEIVLKDGKLRRIDLGESPSEKKIF